jgi:hypothetical protein
MQSLTDSALSLLSKPCVDCGSNCDQILNSMRESLGFPLVCAICGTRDQVHDYGRESLCNSCALEAYS